MPPSSMQFTVTYGDDEMYVTGLPTTNSALIEGSYSLSAELKVYLSAADPGQTTTVIFQFVIGSGSTCLIMFEQGNNIIISYSSRFSVS